MNFTTASFGLFAAVALLAGSACTTDQDLGVHGQDPETGSPPSDDGGAASTSTDSGATKDADQDAGSTSCEPGKVETTSTGCADAGSTRTRTCTESGEWGAYSSCVGSEAGAPAVKRVFVTSQFNFGNLKKAGNAATGLQGADNLCTTYATAAGLGGAWKAWLSDSTTDAIDRIADVSPWYLVDGTTKVFANHAGLGVQPLVGIARDEYGNLINGQTQTRDVWTGTLQNGRKGAKSCADWTSSLVADGPSTCGFVDPLPGGGAWTASSTLDCKYGGRLYCFEQ